MLCSVLICCVVLFSVFGSRRVECVMRIATMPACALDWREQPTDSHHRVLVMFMGSSRAHTERSYTNTEMIQKEEKTEKKKEPQSDCSEQKKPLNRKNKNNNINISILSHSQATLISLPCIAALCLLCSLPPTCRAALVIPPSALRSPDYQVHPVQILAINFGGFDVDAGYSTTKQQ